MASSLLRSRTVLLLPLVLLTVALLEELATYKVRQHVRDVHVRVAIIVALNGIAFAAAASWIAPPLRRMLSSARTGSRRVGALVGVWVFYAIAYGLLYYAFLVLEQRGPGGLLPLSIR
jgi:hypothetical protein